MLMVCGAAWQQLTNAGLSKDKRKMSDALERGAKERALVSEGCTKTARDTDKAAKQATALGVEVRRCFSGRKGSCLNGLGKK